MQTLCLAIDIFVQKYKAVLDLRDVGRILVLSGRAYSIINVKTQKKTI